MEQNNTKYIINELLVDIFHHILAIESEELRRRGINLTMNEVHVLEAVKKSDIPTMSNIAHRLRITLGTLTTVMNRLEKKGYIKRERTEEDKRIIRASLTKDAEQIMEEHDRFHEDMINDVIQDLNLEEDRILVKSLQNISQYFKDKY
jgi:DNA-binding MarR family transcriptional regulator